ncbi:MAG: TetR/AcrR family transcriptional regulator [Candidatus Dormibacteraeota bacterium]|nr:TetR/AcrR family transcriptional regulator [Candidatus Dormibacteraeota bacterium]
MSVVLTRDRRAERNAATRREILDAAWQLVRAEGLAALAMRDLGARVGMRAQSLYVYFPSKYAIYDAMFKESNVELMRRVTALPPTSDPVEGMRLRARTFLDFCVEDPVRYQLLFQRTIPGFEPSPEAYEPALRLLEESRAALRACGITNAHAFDAWTALPAGLAAQQNSNEPGGDRWVRLADELSDMYFEHYRPATARRHK